MAAYEYVSKSGIPDETCMVYEATQHDCSAANICRNCERGKGCFAVTQYKKYTIAQFGAVKGEKDMMAEVYARGPIACGIAANAAFNAYKSGVFEDKTGFKTINHAVSIVGWGEEAGAKYWIARNSFGSAWGEQGLFRIVRGVNNLAIEEACAWAVPA